MDISFLIKEPHWIIVSTVGACIGLILPWIIGSLISFFERRKLHQLEGQWIHYFYNFDVDEAKFKKEIWEIKKGVRHPLVISAKHDDNSGIAYKGIIEFEKEFALIKLKAKTHIESVFLRVPLRAPGSDGVLVALSAAQDYGGRASVGANIITKEELTEEQVKTELQKRTKIDQDKRVMRVKSIKALQLTQNASFVLCITRRFIVAQNKGHFSVS